MMLPAIKAIRERFPSATLTLLTLKRNANLVCANPYLDNVFYLDVDDAFRFTLTIARTIARLARERFDVVCDFEQFAKASTFFVSLSGAPVRVGFDTEGQNRGFIYSEKVPYNNNQHMVETFADIARALGIDAVETGPQPLALSEKDLWALDDLLRRHRIREGDYLVGIHPGSGENFPERRWPLEHFARLADALIEHYNVTVFISGSLDERPLADQMLEMMRHKAINICGTYTLRELAAIMTRCNLFFSNDTAPVHIGSAMGTRIVGFYGPNTPLLYGPRGEGHAVFYNPLSCSPCITNYNQKASSCRYPVCIRSISVEEVLEVVSGLYFAGSSPGAYTAKEKREDAAHARQECPLCRSTRTRTLYRLPRAKYPGFFGPIIACSSCRLVFRQLHITQEDELATFYDDSYFKDGYLREYDAHYEERLDREELALYRSAVRHIAPFRTRGRILDVGCATGVLLDIAKKAGWPQAYGIDISPYAAQYAHRQFGVEMHVGTVHDSPFEKGGFDAVTLWDTIEHLEDPFADARAINRLLRKGGAFVIMTQNHRSLLPRAAHFLYLISFGVITWPLYALYDNCHTFFFSVTTLRLLLAKAGFEVQCIEKRGGNVDKREERHYPVNRLVKAGVKVLNIFDRLSGNGYRLLLYAKKVRDLE